MADNLGIAREYLALAENTSDGDAADMVQLSIAHSLAGILAHLTGDETPVEEVPVPGNGQRKCVLCGREGTRWFEETHIGLICSHYGQCANRRQEADK